MSLGQCMAGRAGNLAGPTDEGRVHDAIGGFPRRAGSVPVLGPCAQSLRWLDCFRDGPAASASPSFGDSFPERASIQAPRPVTPTILRRSPLSTPTSAYA